MHSLNKLAKQDTKGSRQAPCPEIYNRNRRNLN